MKKVIHTIYFLFFISLLTAQEGTVTHELASFTDVKVFDGLSVVLVKSDENKAVISGANTDKVAIVNNGGVLKLRMEINKLFSGYRTKITLYHTAPLAIVDVNEDAKIESDYILKNDVLELRSQEGGELILEVEADQLLIKCVTGGTITAKGTTNVQDININTGGIYHGEDLRSNYTTVEVNAGSNAEIYAKDYVQATVRAGGEVKVYGNPAKMDEKTVFGGKVTRM